jgi:hypothetical protein
MLQVERENTKLYGVQVNGKPLSGIASSGRTAEIKRLLRPTSNGAFNDSARNNLCSMQFTGAVFIVTAFSLEPRPAEAIK